MKVYTSGEWNFQKFFLQLRSLSYNLHKQCQLNKFLKMSRFICWSIHHEFTGNLSRIHKKFQKSLWRIFHFYFVNWLQNWWKIFHKQVSAKLMVDFQKILGKLSIYFVVNFQEKIPWIFCEKFTANWWKLFICGKCFKKFTVN